jgi:hypothetical protein
VAAATLDGILSLYRRLLRGHVRDLLDHRPCSEAEWMKPRLRPNAGSVEKTGAGSRQRNASQRRNAFDNYEIGTGPIGSRTTVSDDDAHPD